MVAMNQHFCPISLDWLSPRAFVGGAFCGLLYVWAIGVWAYPLEASRRHAQYVKLPANFGVLAHLRTDSFAGRLGECVWLERPVFGDEGVEVGQHVVSKPYCVDGEPCSLRAAITRTVGGYDSKEHRGRICVGQDELSDQQDWHIIVKSRDHRLQHNFIFDALPICVQGDVAHALQLRYKTRFDRRHKPFHFLLNRAFFLARLSCNVPNAKVGLRVFAVGRCGRENHILNLLNLTPLLSFTRETVSVEAVAANNNRVGCSDSHYGSLSLSVPRTVGYQTDKQENTDTQTILESIWGDGPLTRATAICIARNGDVDIYDGDSWFHWIGPRCLRKLPTKRGRLYQTP
jgi:hypothetical protein